ncbi:hypothetical protein SDRG_03028 [Saprolegnia diclina VS20]|uniref:F-box domain-containing protein n=1 Tax=Saprolegnia diclina (strain VS20) TaxID=1156394 RepID=T0QND8_SAPDV|nr:hypothetical protein SDRG_03028 [Saprolegnia diclina VS20]EQC39594.1 hypothetical protein SDRG_03028 [Saprolegnia diclina VS20]|eukprot:XP_008606866.1 hypothetical protein SDRG_03028 [Saprolegnia diclina VS20]
MPHALLQVDLLHLIARYLPTRDAFLSFIRALPHDCLGYPLQCWRELSTRMPLDELWPRLQLPARLRDDDIALFRGASLVFSHVVLSQPFDLALLRRCVQPHAQLQLLASSLPPAPTPAWYNALATFSIASLQGARRSCDGLASALPLFDALCALDLGRTEPMTKKQQGHLVTALETALPALLSLRLRHDELAKETLGALTAWIATRPVRGVGLVGSGDAAPRALCAALHASNTLHVLDVEQSPLGLKICRDVSPGHWPTLTVLRLSACALTARNVKKLLPGLPTQSLRKLDLVHYLHLANAGLTPKGLLALASMLRRPSRLTTLYLENEAIDDRSLARFVKLIAQSPTLQYVALWHMVVGVESAMDMVEALYHNQKLEVVLLGSSALSARAAQIVDSCYGVRATRFFVTAPPLASTPLNIPVLQAALDSAVNQRKRSLPSCAWAHD